MFAFDFKFISADIDLTRSKIFVTVIEHYIGGGGGGCGVFKEICGTVRLPVLLHDSRQ